MLKKTDLGVGLYLLCAILFFIIPIPSFLLDVMLAFNLSIALIILFKVLFVKEVLDMSFFPTLLLFTTIFRISLNVSSTRLILSTGNPGVVVNVFGQFVGGGNFVFDITTNISNSKAFIFNNIPDNLIFNRKTT